MRKTGIFGAYAAIGEETPLSMDCGKLCAAACCAPDADGQGGVYLFPGEERILRDADWATIVDAGRFAPVLVCSGVCPRGQRPLGCRIFPLTPVRTDRGWTVRIDARARAMCPLAGSGIHGLRSAFVRAVRRAVRLLAEEPGGEEFLRSWAAEEQAFRDGARL